MSFLYPTYFWSLLALIVPIGIHLWNKKEGRVIRVGSVQFFGASDTKQTSSIKLNELFLLIFRCLVIAVLAVLLARPVIPIEFKTEPVVYLIERDLLNEEHISRMIDTLSKKEAVRLLASGFPPIEVNADISYKRTPNYWRLVREMESLSADSIVIFTRAWASGFKGKRATTSKNLSWIIVEPDEAKEMLIEAISAGDSTRLKMAISDKQHLSYQNMAFSDLNEEQILKHQDAVKLRLNHDQHWIRMDTLKTKYVLIVWDEGFESEVKYFQASFNAVGRYLEHPFKISVKPVDKVTATDQKVDVMVWLSEKPFPHVAFQYILFRPDSLINNIIADTAEPNIYYITSKLTPEVAVQEHLSDQLLKILNIHSRFLPEVESYDHSVADLNMIEPNQKEKGEVIKEVHQEISEWIWLLLVLLIIGERTLALYRNQ